jgi:hypothetical protein
VAVSVPRGPGQEEGNALMDYVVHRLKGDLFADLMEHMWEGGCPRVEFAPIPQPNLEPEPVPESLAGPLPERPQGVMGWAWAVADRVAPRMTRWLRTSRE